MGRQKIDKNWNNLSILTKNEIIEYLKNHHPFSAPTIENINYFKWDTMMKKYLEKVDEYNKNTEHREWAKKADELAVKCNNECDWNKKLGYLNERENYIKKLKKHHNKWAELDKEYKMIEDKYGRKN